MSDTIFIGVAWPYANGDLHLGHVAGSLLPPDIFRRYHKLAGNDVLMVSGSDMHGTPITVSAEEEGVEPEDFAARYNARHKASLRNLSIEFDLFTSTATANHQEVVHDLFLTLLDAGYIDQREMTSLYDPEAERFIPDRYVEGTCPHCGYDDARGDQCDECGRTLDPDELQDPRSKLTGAEPEERDTEHFFLRLSDLEPRLEAWVEEQQAEANWRSNAVNFTRNWLDEGLRDRAITRDLTYGIPIPEEAGEFPTKRIYVWFEAVTGYLSAAKQWARDVAGDEDAWRAFWQDPDARAYYFLGKDNIPFHTIIWPAMIMGYREGKDEHHNLPYDVPANEFLNLGSEQFSKSRGVAIWADDVVERFGVDAVRYYLTVNMPEVRDAAWTWEDFLSKVNDELVGAYGNFAHRVLTFTKKHFGEVPQAPPEDERTRESVERLGTVHATVTEHLEACQFKKALKEVMTLAREGNRYLDEQAPWTLIKTDEAAAGAVLHHGLRIARALAIMTAPFLPDSAQDLWTQLGQEGSVHDASWDAALEPLAPGTPLGEPQVLFTKLDPDEVLGNSDTDDDTANAMEEPPMPENLVSFDDFQQLDLRIGHVTSVEDHPDADKLYVVKVDVGGETRQLVAGLKPFMAKDAIEGKRVVVVANLEPAKLRGVESQGMLLAAEDDGEVSLLRPEKDLPAGSKVK